MAGNTRFATCDRVRVDDASPGGAVQHPVELLELFLRTLARFELEEAARARPDFGAERPVSSPPRVVLALSLLGALGIRHVIVSQASSVLRDGRRRYSRHRRRSSRRR